MVRCVGRAPALRPISATFSHPFQCYYFHQQPAEPRVPTGVGLPGGSLGPFPVPALFLFLCAIDSLSPLLLLSLLPLLPPLSIRRTPAGESWWSSGSMLVLLGEGRGIDSRGEYTFLCFFLVEKRGRRRRRRRRAAAPKNPVFSCFFHSISRLSASSTYVRPLLDPKNRAGAFPQGFRCTRSCFERVFLLIHAPAAARGPRRPIS